MRPLQAIAAIIVATLIALTVAIPARGQVIEVMTDLNMPTISGEATADHPALDIDHGLSLRVSVLSRQHVRGTAPGRFVVTVGAQSLKTARPASPATVTKYTAISIEAGGDWRLLARSGMRLSLGATAGLFLIKSDDGIPCDTAFCNLPDGGLVLTGAGRCEVPLSHRFAFVMGLRGWLLSRDREEMRPFENGLVVSLGIQLS